LKKRSAKKAPDIKCKNVFEFITKRSFFFNLLVAIGLGVGTLFTFLALLNQITRHGQYVTVPDVKGKSIDEARRILEAQGFRISVQDSVFIDSLPRLSITRQVPLPGEQVKINRTIYLTINRQEPPTIEMPNLVGQTFRSAEMQLRMMGLKLGDTTYKPDFAVGSVLEQLINGKPVSFGTRIPMGSRIDLVLGGGVQRVEMPVPNLLGLTLAEARLLLEENSILPGAIVADGAIADSAAAYVFKQNPPPRNEEGVPLRIRGGQLIDLWITTDQAKADSAKTKAFQRPAKIPEPVENEY
jgi:beta-lactam-binding protein with PASTA domain